MTHPVDISIRTILKVVLVTLSIFVAYQISDILIMIVFAVIIASAVYVWEGKMSRVFGSPRIINIIFIYLLAISILAGVFYLIVPLFLGEIGNLAENLPAYQDKIAKSFGSSKPSFEFFNRFQEFLSTVEGKILAVGGGAVSLFANIFTGIASMIITFVLSFYMSLQSDGVEKFLKFITPKAHELYVVHLWQNTQKKLGRWLQGQLLLGLIIGIVVFIGLSLLGIPYAFVLAVLASILELVPMAGPILASIPAIILGFLISPMMGLLTIVFYGVVQQLENHFIVPMVMKKAVGLNPVIVIISLLVGSKLGGIVGMLLAVPMAAVIVEIMGDKGEQTHNVL